MLRAEITLAGLHARQAGCLPGQFGLVVTRLELKSSFLGTAREGTIRTECRAEHLGRTTHVWSATVLGPDERRLAQFRCTQMILT